MPDHLTIVTLSLTDQGDNIPLNVQPFCWNRKTLSCNGHLKWIVHQLQQKCCHHLKGCTLKD